MITVLGATGFIGCNIVKKLQQDNEQYFAPKRDENLLEKDLGNVIYCIGLTADFRTKPFETVDAHIITLQKILQNCKFKSLTYLSTTRVYIHANSMVAKEDDQIIVNPNNFEDLYNLTKLTGERLCLSSGKNTKIVRLSNVTSKPFYKSSSFLSQLIKQAEETKKVFLHQHIDSEKDYIHIDDVVDLVLKIAKNSKESVYNIGSGINTSNKKLLDELKKYYDFELILNSNANTIKFPVISNAKICSEFFYKPITIENQLKTIFKI